jgi:multiple antibiotic resistance protein
MDVWGSTSGAFLLAFSALVSIVNPIGGALIYNEVTARRPADERRRLARKIAVYALLVMLAALWAGAAIISFFGISLASLRIAGGFYVAARAWGLLSAPEENEDRKQEQAATASLASDVAFFPLTLPFTTGPGTIAVAIALSGSRPSGSPEFAAFFAGTSLAALAVAACVGIAYSFAGTVVTLLGPRGSRVLSRVAAFLLLCIGTQILLNGLDDAFGTFMRHARQ